MPCHYGAPLYPREAPLAAYEWLVCHLLQESAQQLRTQLRTGSSDFEARNNSQVRFGPAHL